jgi:5-methylcytosine-specific restriction enzyme subunit McrC
LKALELDAWSALPCELTHAEAAAIEASGLVEVVAEPTPGRWRLVGNSRVGVASGSTWELRVRPRLEVSQLLFLLGYATDPNGWRDERAFFEPVSDLFEAIAHGFAWQALRLAEQGLIRGYRQVDERLPTVRGRIRFADQIARSALPLPVELSFDEYTPDIRENRILKIATLALLGMPRVGPLARRRLLKLRAVLDPVALESRSREATLPPFTRLNERYRPALRLAQLILRASSLGGARGPFAASAFVFDMNRVFEEFLTASLREALRPWGGEVRAQQTSSLDIGGRVAIRPDVVWQVGGRPRAVVDAKHKALGSGPRTEDAYQVLAYCTALGLSRGYLVYAQADGAEAVDLVVRNVDCEVRVRTLDLAREPEALLDLVRELAAELAA